MKMRARIVVFLAFIMIVIVAIGCGKKTEEEEGADSSGQYRIPDSLLEAKAQFQLTLDDYHPIKGGVMANAQIEMHYPAMEVERLLAIMTFGKAYEGYHTVIKAIGRPADGKIVLIGAKDLPEYQLLTRKEWWYYGYIAGDTIFFEPYNLMFRRGIVDVAIPQRIAQVALNRRSGGKMPLWMKESIASYVAIEGDILKIYGRGLKMQKVDVLLSPEEIEAALAEATDMDRTRAAYYASYIMLENLLKFASMDDALGFADKLRDGRSPDEASQAVFGMGYEELLDRVRIDKEKPKQ